MPSERLYGDPSSWEHAVAHVDMDAFYVSVELLSRPDLRGKPVIVGPADPASRGVVMTASYEARKFGVHSALPIAVARRRCPQAIVVPRNMESYQAASAQVMEVFHHYSDLVEVVGMDEAYIDLSGSPAPKARARQIKRDVLAKTGLTCSIGLGPNRLIAKIASDLDKPDGLCVLPRERFLEVVGDRPARIIPGVGPRTEERLTALEIKTVADLAGAPEVSLATILGPKHARSLGRRACGFGSAEVAVERERKSESRERTFASDQSDPTMMRQEVVKMARTVAEHLGKQEIRGPHGHAEDPARPVPHLHPLADAGRADRGPRRRRRFRASPCSTPSSGTLRSACSGSGCRTWCGPAAAATKRAPPPTAPMRRRGRDPCSSPLID